MNFHNNKDSLVIAKSCFAVISKVLFLRKEAT